MICMPVMGKGGGSGPWKGLVLTRRARGRFYNLEKNCIDQRHLAHLVGLGFGLVGFVGGGAEPKPAPPQHSIIADETSNDAARQIPWAF
jgi:hypothetical protein